MAKRYWTEKRIERITLDIRSAGVAIAGIVASLIMIWATIKAGLCP